MSSSWRPSVFGVRPAARGNVRGGDGDGAVGTGVDTDAVVGLRECRHWRTGLDGDFFVFEGRLDDLAHVRIFIWEEGVAALEDGDVRPGTGCTSGRTHSRRSHRR